MLKKFKKQLQREEEALEIVKRHFKHLASLQDENILSYLNIVSRGELVAFAADLQLDRLLTPDNRETIVCTCTDEAGQPKSLYATEAEAEQRSAFLSKEQRITLRVYSCPTTNG